MRIAAIDVGSNSIHLVVVETDAMGNQQVLAREKHMVRLAKGLLRTGEIGAEAFQAGLAVLELMMEHPDSGFVLGHRVRRARPGTPVLLVTGVTGETGLEFDAATAEERRWVPADAVLPKPIRYEQLKAEIDRLLG